MSHMLIGEKVSLEGQEMVVDLIMMDIPDFGVILGIDFLSKNGVVINYRKNKVLFNLDNSELFNFRES